MRSQGRVGWMTCARAVMQAMRMPVTAVGTASTHQVTGTHQGPMEVRLKIAKTPTSMAGHADEEWPMSQRPMAAGSMAAPAQTMGKVSESTRPRRTRSTRTHAAEREEARTRQIAKDGSSGKLN